MKRVRGFTLLEMMLVLLLLGVSSSLVMLSIPADGEQLTRQGMRLKGMLADALERAERQGSRYGVAFSSNGWRRVSEKASTVKEDYILPTGMVLQLSIEGRTVPLDVAPEKTPQIWLYPGGETTSFRVTLLQKKCQWQVLAPGYFVFETTDVRCHDTEV